jgi:hypothetical protein
VTTIAPNVFAISYPNPGSHIKYGDTLLPFTNDTSYGSILTEIHCDCTIFLPDEKRTITPIFPCAERPLPLLQTHIIPFQWTTLAIPALPSLDICTLPRYSHLEEIKGKDWFKSMSVSIFKYQPPQDFPCIIYAQATGVTLILFTWNILLTIMVVYVAFRLYQLFALIPFLAVAKAISSSRSPRPQRCQIDPYIEILLNPIVIVLLSKLLAKRMLSPHHRIPHLFRSTFFSPKLQSLFPTAAVRTAARVPSLLTLQVPVPTPVTRIVFVLHLHQHVVLHYPSRVFFPLFLQRSFKHFGTQTLAGGFCFCC